LGVALWANLHGGFLAGPLVVASAALGHAISGSWDAERRQRLRTLASVFAVSCVAPLANPYGIGLYRHVTGLLFTSGVTKLINEYQPPAFGTPEARVLEWFILALIGLQVFSRSRLSRYELTHTLAWLHLAISSIRQAPLFALAASAGLAQVANGMLAPAKDPERDRERGEWSIWPMLASVALVASVQAGVVWGKLKPTHWPTKALPVLNRQPIDARLFHDQDWGGMIEAECRPHRPTYLDDRFELFGKQEILDYLAALQGGPGWDAILAREHFELAWVRSDCGLAKRLASDPGWEPLFRDSVSVLYKRRR
jgi:hypothetical protein